MAKKAAEEKAKAASSAQTDARGSGGGPQPPRSPADASEDDPDDPLLTLQEVLALVRHGRSWLYKMMNAGLFPRGYKLVKRRLWRRSEVLAAIARLLTPVEPT